MFLPTNHAQHHQHPSQKIQLMRKTLKTELHPNSRKRMITVHEKVMETSQSFPARKKEAGVFQ